MAKNTKTFLIIYKNTPDRRGIGETLNQPGEFFTAYPQLHHVDVLVLHYSSLKFLQ